MKNLSIHSEGSVYSRSSMELKLFGCRRCFSEVSNDFLSAKALSNQLAGCTTVVSISTWNFTQFFKFFDDF
jgi:hypothetical protein